MFDIHSHILWGVDDGPSGIEETIELVYAAAQAGIEAIVCTPHYIEDSYKNSAADNLAVLDRIKKIIEQNAIGVALYLGNEIYITPDILRLLDSNKITTLNNSKYILIEMPIYSKPLFTDDIIFKLRLRGLIPIIAHPERYAWVRANPKELSNMIDKGCLTQLNTSSINGYYGKTIKKAAITLIKENYIHSLGSDSHTSKKIYNTYKTDLKLLQSVASEYKLKQIHKNTEAIINNQEIENFT